MLNHVNTDIAVDVFEVLSELTDPEVLSSSDDFGIAQATGSAALPQGEVEDPDGFVKVEGEERSKVDEKRCELRMLRGCYLVDPCGYIVTYCVVLVDTMALFEL